MKTALCAVAVAFASLPALARAESPPAIIPKPIVIAKAPDVASIAARDAFVDRQTRLMSTLGSWAITSIATGAMLWATGGDDYTRAVGVQNVAWGAIDGMIAGFGYRGARKDMLLDKPVSHWQAEERKLRKILFINAGLDVLYVAAGALMYTYGKNDLLRGSGAGVMLQGSFLFAFDTASGFGAK